MDRRSRSSHGARHSDVDTWTRAVRGGGRVSDVDDVTANTDAGNEGDIDTPIATNGGVAIRRAVRRPYEYRRRMYKVVFWGETVPEARLLAHSDRIKYAVWQLEACPTTGKKHWQMFLMFHQPVSMDFIKIDLLADVRTHIEPPRHDEKVDDCVMYCKKEYSRVQDEEAGPFELHSYTQQGARTDLDRIRRDIADGRTMSLVARDHGSALMRYPSGVKLMMQMEMQKRGQRRNQPPIVNVFFGSTGTGKTRKAMEEALERVDGDVDKVYCLDSTDGSGGLWWDGYEGQPCVIVDEMYNWMPWGTLLRLTDRYPYRLPVKGSFSYLLCDWITFTSNFHPLRWTDKGSPVDVRHLKAFMRRVTNLLELKDGGVIIRHPTDMWQGE